jgi:pimeloyl-ACP methyl ester carboxylesterase
MTMLLLHGALGTRAQLDALGALVTRRRPVLQVEFEGHGTTPPRERPFSVEGFVENAVAALDSAGLEKVDVFGYSMGGYVALALALAHPGRVSTITTLGTKFAWDPATAERAVGHLQPAVLTARAPDVARALAEQHVGAGGWEALIARTSAFLTGLGARPHLGSAELARIHHRVRIMVGDRDRTVSVEESAEAFRHLPSGELMVLPRTVHPMEQVDVYRLADVLIELTS